MRGKNSLRGLTAMLAALAVFGWRVTVISTDINRFFWLTANVCLFTLLFNFNPDRTKNQLAV